MIIDSHCHLNYEDSNKDIDSLIKNADLNNVKIFLNISTKHEDFKILKKTSLKYENVYYTLGIHPHESFQTNQFNDVKKLNIIESTLITGGVFTLTYILISQVYKFIAFGFTVSESETVRGSDVPINFCLLITLVISSNIIRIIQNK